MVCFMFAIWSVSCLQYGLFHVCNMVCFMFAIWSVSCLQYGLFHVCNMVCFMFAIWSVSCLQYGLFHVCNMVCFMFAIIRKLERRISSPVCLSCCYCHCVLISMFIPCILI